MFVSNLRTIVTAPIFIRRSMTAPSVLKQQKIEALQRAESAAQSMSSEYPEILEEVEALKGVRGRDHLHVEAARLDALANILEALADAKGIEGEGPVLLEDLSSINQGHINKLKAKGISNVEILRSRDDQELEDIDGIGRGTVEKIRAEIGYPADED
jgi:DNA uptake protein ComE-like DNA-binding protein